MEFLRNLIKRFRNQQNLLLQAGLLSLIVIVALAGALSFILQDETVRTPFQEETIISYTNANGETFKLRVELANTAAEREQGLMNREFLPENAGMLFVFPSESIRTFWMKDTPISLDIIFLDSQRRVVDIKEQTIPNQTQQLYTSAAPAQYVLEVNAGWVDKASLKSGEQFNFSP